MTDYGSGIYPGPTTSAIQDPGWADPDLQWGFLGDSITYRAAPKLRTAFGQAGVSSFAVRAHSGQNWAGSLNWLDSLTYLPDRLIISLGANDVQNPFGVPAQLERLAAILAGTGTELFLMDTYVNRPAYPNHDLRNSGQVNGYLRQAVDAAHTINWAAALTSAVGRGLPVSYYIQDGVHPWVDAGEGHGDGTGFLAAVVMQTVQPYLV